MGCIAAALQVPRLHAYNTDVAALTDWLQRFESLRPIDGERSVDAIAADVKAIVDAKLAAVAAAKAAAAAEAARIAAEAEEKAAAAAEAARQKAEAEEKARLEWEAVRLSGTRGRFESDLARWVDVLWVSGHGKVPSRLRRMGRGGQEEGAGRRCRARCSELGSLEYCQYPLCSLEYCQ